MMTEQKFRDCFVDQCNLFELAPSEDLYRNTVKRCEEIITENQTVDPFIDDLIRDALREVARQHVKDTVKVVARQIEAKETNF